MTCQTLLQRLDGFGAGQQLDAGNLQRLFKRAAGGFQLIAFLTESGILGRQGIEAEFGLLLILPLLGLQLLKRVRCTKQGLPRAVKFSGGAGLLLG